MSVQLAVATRNAKLEAIETEIGTDPTLEIRTGAQPANCAAADAGSLLATLTLPADWLAAAASGQKAKNGTWSGTASGAGTAAHFRIKSSGGVCKVQGSIGQGSGDLSLDNTNIANGQTITVSSFTLTEGNA